MIGVWQDLAIFAAGWSNAYQFFPDGRFVLNYNQMDCGKRVEAIAGHYLATDSTLTLIVEERHVLEGGRLEPPLGSCGGEGELIGAAPRIAPMMPFDTTRHSFAPPESAMAKIPDFRGNGDTLVARLQLKIDGVAWYQMRQVPDSYP